MGFAPPVSALMSISGFGLRLPILRDVRFEYEDMALPGLFGAMRVASGASSEEFDDEDEEEYARAREGCGWDG